jgi:hypothetical protein
VVIAVGALGAAFGLSACTTPYGQSTTVTTIHAPGSPTTVPSTAAASSARTLLNQNGQGSGVSKTFHASVTPWKLNWGITCYSGRGRGSFNVLKKTTGGFESVWTRSVRIAESYNASASFRQAGVFKIEISSSCTWNAFVTEPN